MTPEPYRGGSTPPSGYRWIRQGGTHDNDNINEIMESSEFYNTGDYPETMEELLDAMEDPSGRYKHLRIILYRNRSSIGLGLGQQYLVVNKNGFGLYQLTDINYSNGILVMTFANPKTCNMAKVTLDINNKHPEHFLIGWNDLKQLVYEETISDIIDDEILELENDTKPHF